MTDGDWLAYRRTPEQRAILHESSDRRIRRAVWYTLNHIPPSLRAKYYLQLPNYIADKVQTRVEQIEKQKQRKERR